jgi:1-acyl-sn-glycerol-3-phosphate acyltransferase
MIGRILAFSTRFLTGGTPRWRGCLPGQKQRIYFANHTSNLDFVLLWSALPTALRQRTRPVGAQDYWTTPIRGYFARHVFRAVLIERKRVTRANNPLTPMLSALSDGDSLIIFPEGTRLAGDELGEFKPGLHYLAAARPDVELIPVFIDNLNRVLPKGEILPVPMLCSVHFGGPVAYDASESKTAFLTRARAALGNLRPQ